MDAGCDQYPDTARGPRSEGDYRRGCERVQPRARREAAAPRAGRGAAHRIVPLHLKIHESSVMSSGRYSIVMVRPGTGLAGGCEPDDAGPATIQAGASSRARAGPGDER